MSDQKLRVLFIGSEMSPYLELTKVAEFARQLPQAIQERGIEIRVLMPRYGVINERRHRLHEVVRLSGINIIIEDNDNPLIIKVASLPQARMQVYFLDNEEYFQRKVDLRDKNGEFCADNDERLIFFCKGAIETVIKLGWAPDVVQLNGWLTSLIPMYLKKQYADNPVFRDTKIVSGIFENQFTELLDEGFTRRLKFDEFADEDLTELETRNNDALYLNAVRYSDAITLGSDQISETVMKAIQESGKPTLGYLEKDERGDAYRDFYQQVAGA